MFRQIAVKSAKLTNNFTEIWHFWKLFDDFCLLVSCFQNLLSFILFTNIQIFLSFLAWLVQIISFSWKIWFKSAIVLQVHFLLVIGQWFDILLERPDKRQVSTKVQIFFDFQDADSKIQPNLEHLETV